MKKVAFMKYRKLKDETSESLLCLLNYGHEKWLLYTNDSVRIFLAKHNQILINAILFTNWMSIADVNNSFCTEVLSSGKITGKWILYSTFKNYALYHCHCSFYNQPVRSAWINKGIYDSETDLQSNGNKMSFAYMQLLDQRKNEKKKQQ